MIQKSFLFRFSSISDKMLQKSGEKKCVVLTDTPLATQIRVNEFCRSKGVAFISCDVRGLFCWGFTDFGPSFDIFDKDGEELKEVLIGNISNVISSWRILMKEIVNMFFFFLKRQILLWSQHLINVYTNLKMMTLSNLERSREWLSSTAKFTK